MVIWNIRPKVILNFKCYLVPGTKKNFDSISSATHNRDLEKNGVWKVFQLLVTSGNGNYVDLPLTHEEGEFKELFFIRPSRLRFNSGHYILLKAFSSVSCGMKIKRIVLKSFILNESRNFSVKNYLKINLSIIYSNRSFYSTLHSWYCVSEEQWSS